MRRYIGKFNWVDLPNGSPDSLEGALLVLKKSGPRAIPDALTGPGTENVTRRGVPQIGKGDELWICTDKSGPGIYAVAQVRDVVTSSGNVEIRVGRARSIKNPIKLSDFERLQSGSKVFGQLQRSRRPDLYLMKEFEFEEFERVIITRKGPSSLPNPLDWGETIEPKEEVPKAETASLTQQPGQKHPFALNGYSVDPNVEATNSLYVATLGKGGRVLKIGHAKDAKRRVDEFNKFRLSSEPQWVLHTDQPIGTVQEAIEVEKHLGEAFEKYRTELNNNEVYVNLDPMAVLTKLATFRR